MNRQLFILIDPIEHLHPEKDSSLAFVKYLLIQENWSVYLIFPGQLWLDNGVPWAKTNLITEMDSKTSMPQLAATESQTLSTADAIWIRQDPPFDMDYLTMTYVMSLTEQQGTVLINAPEGIRAANEKMCIHWFPKWCPPTRVTQDIGFIESFLHDHGKAIIKPLDQMGGRGIFLLDENDPNRRSIMENSTAYGTRMIMVQAFLPDIRNGDVRIILIDGCPASHALVRMPSKDDFRGNMATGGTTSVRPITETEGIICADIGPKLAAMGLMFVGIDLIGDKLTEINVTSPTGIVQIETHANIQVSALLLEAIEKKLI